MTGNRRGERICLLAFGFPCHRLFNPTPAGGWAAYCPLPTALLTSAADYADLTDWRGGDSWGGSLWDKSLCLKANLGWGTPI